ncbi:hypothetical protein K440DRAFT_627253 [Wilcoxina mikolae CBS 423.85]|nr:hypothetical protein K440DRAFT_627253 [Wilcoxina mikolae CBS 423.85]
MYKPQSPWPALKQEYVPHKWMNWTERGPSVPEGPPEQPVDIIAVQGLASSYEWTWNAVLEDGRNVMWLRDLLPSDLPEARILTFEYDSKWMQTKRDDPAFVTLEDCGKRLLQSVIWDRTHKYEDEMCKTMKRRPMILIGHSYGGLVIKSAMIQAAFTNPAEPYYEDYQSFLTSVSGIVFLGTPHNGSGFARHGMTQTFWGSLFGKKSNPAILRPLAEGPASIELRELNKAFFRIKIFERNRNLKLFYFYETKRVKISGVEINLVVDKESACWGAEHGCDAPLGTDHMNMNKFGCREDENYKLVSDRLQRLHRQAKIVVSERWGKYQYTNQHASPELIELNRWLDPCRLATDVSKLRVERVEGTCKWVLTEDALLRWADTTSISDSGHEAKSYFICGKAGSGKSTLAVYIRDWLERRLRSMNSGPVCTGVGGSSTCVDPSTQGHALLFFSFFGNRNLVPVIGTLAHQLLEQHSENPQLLQIATNFHKNNPELTPEAAMQLLIRLTSALSRTYIIIDGLDECDDRRRLIELLEGLCQSDRIRLLVVARKELIIEEHSRNIFPSEEMILDIALKNRDDIRFFIQGQVRMLVEKKPVLATIRDVIANRINHDSRGMFQWAKLMIDALQYLDSHESDEENVLRALEGFPQDLNGAYRKTFDRLAAIPRYDINYARAVLKLLVCATRPLTLQELAMAIELYQLLGNGSNGLTTAAEMCSQNVSSKRNNQLRERFTKLLGPMIEFHQSAAEPGHVTIHMCHHSLTQLLQGECDSMPSSKLQTPQWDSCRDFSFTPASAHEFAAQCCFQAICAGESLRTYLEGFYHKSDLPPFLGYAFENWSFHLHASGIPLETDHNLVGWVEESLRTSLHMSMFALAGVGEILGRLDFGVCFETIHMIAFRDCQTRLQDAVEAAAKVLPILPSLAGEIQKARLSGAQRRQGPTIRRRANFDSKISKPTAAFGTFLDSVLLTEVFTLIDVEPDILKPLQGYLIVLRDASRKLRRLTVALSVDPICTWLYHHIGDKEFSSASLRSTVLIPCLVTFSLLVSNWIAVQVIPSARHFINDISSINITPDLESGLQSCLPYS